jgi:hypothetical protein
MHLTEMFKTHTKSPSQERVRVVFSALDDMIPHVGPLSAVLKIIRDELYASVYSKDFTVTASDAQVRHLPYFGLVNRIERLT